MRILLFILSGSLSLSAWAQPEQLEPLQPVATIDAETGEPLPPIQRPQRPRINEFEDAPEVTIIKKTEQTIEEFRVGGQLYMIKVTPSHGKPYYLIDETGEGKFTRKNGLDKGFRAPQWILIKF